MRIIKLTEESKKDLLHDLIKRSPNQYTQYEDTVNGIISDVRENGDKAVFSYTKNFDKWDCTPSNVKVTEEEIKEAYASLDPEFVSVMKRSAENIRSFHEKQVRNSWIDTKPDGSILGQKIIPIEISGVYVPGGKAAYPSSVLMNVIPAKVAGVNEIYKVGGAQAIAAMAFGTESIPKVDKITGPGNIFVALAKKACFGFVSIDSIAGPSEIMVLADETANPRYAAADLLSQAEHDELASAIMITTSEELGNKVSDEVDRFLSRLSRREIIQKSLDNYGYILIADSLDDAIDGVNVIAPEHLEILTSSPFEVMPKIKNAGAIFLGENSSEPLGDYYAGPNHILPTNGTARFFSPLSVDDFVKKSSIISYSREALYNAHKDIELFAKNEGLTAHANSIHVRFDQD
jgi:histidinol dehydrogenase